MAAMEGPDLVCRSLSQGADAPVVPAQPAFDVLDVLAELDEFAPVFASGGDRSVEHGDDCLAEDLVMRSSRETTSVGAGFSTGCVRQVFRVEEVHTYLTCDFAVGKEHGDVENGAARVEREARPRLWITSGKA
ncbi:hypothetical protein [Streptomyces sp. NL15-2K]|uniref:hypothetical protein n=1 Tax=Streptomyces sp. NL15-2K TaxID=376149 RepID=UPI00209C59AE|nr:MULTISPECIES: hypothetical protein [Actinomycetes]WKX10768.1 hypothetical protein Q4V64_26000 [Kutzneria buriramensis]